LDAIDDEDDRRAARFATAYLECIDGKGDHAQELNLKLRERGDAEITVPRYIKDAIEWVCHPTN
jgi:hypothetical protein